MQERLDDLEAKFSFQEDTLQQLNEVIIQQRRMLDEVQQKVDWLEGQVAGSVGRQGQCPGLVRGRRKAAALLTSSLRLSRRFKVKLPGGG